MALSLEDNPARGIILLFVFLGALITVLLIVSKKTEDDSKCTGDNTENDKICICPHCLNKQPIVNKGSKKPL